MSHFFKILTQFGETLTNSNERYVRDLVYSHFGNLTFSIII